MSSMRHAKLAGAWYPADGTGCERAFETYRQDAREAKAKKLVAGIVPHAGWVYSGSIAYNVLWELSKKAAPVDTVLLFCGHLRPRDDVTIMADGACETPFGPLETDDELAAAIIDGAPGIAAESASHHTQDNSAEVQFPMIKHCFPQSRIVVIGAPPRPETVKVADVTVEAARRLGRRVVAVGSTDLTHYGPNYGWAPHGDGVDAEDWVRNTNDRRFIDRTLTMDPQAAMDTAMAEHNACCSGSVAAAIRFAQLLGATGGQELRYATSSDVRRSSSFVGYVGLVF